MKDRFRVGAFAVVFDDARRVLLAHRRDCDFWGLPGGGVEAGDPPWQGVVREVSEETGLDVVVERLIGIYCWPREHDIIFSFACVLSGGSLATSEEACNARFFPSDALPTNTFVEHVQRVRDALCPRHEAVLRVPAGPSATEERQHSEC
jgi:ADP-ribose pyrophosphatase YjhB (NUDIX family)